MRHVWVHLSFRRDARAPAAAPVRDRARVSGEPESVWAVMSAYRPSASARRAVRSVRDQVDGVVVVDDGSGASASLRLDELRDDGALVEVLADNGGIAAALNRGVALARRRGATHVLMLDQDSVLTPGFVAELLRASRADARVGAVVPEYFSQVRQATTPFVDGVADAAHVIQSGMLVPTTVFDDVGGLREDFFIDLVDTEFELRLRRAGYRVVAAGGLRLEHALGVQHVRTVFGRPVRLPGIPPVVTLSTPFRYFYRVRNRIVLLGEYGRAFPGRMAQDAVIDLLHFVDVLCAARPRRAMAKVMRAGVNAGVHRRMGRMPQALARVAGGIVWSSPAIDVRGEAT